MGCVGWKKQLTSSKLWAKNSKKLALQHPLQGQVTNGLTSARLPLFRALPPSGSVTCWLPWLQCVTLGGCRPTAIHSSAKGTSLPHLPVEVSRLGFKRTACLFPQMSGPGWACVLLLSPPTALSTVGVWTRDPGTVVPTLNVAPGLVIFLSQLPSKPSLGA